MSAYDDTVPATLLDGLHTGSAWDSAMADLEALPLLTPTEALMGEAGMAMVLQPASSTPLAAAGPTAQVRQGLRVGPLALMVRIDEGRQLAEMPTLYRLPQTPDWFCGMANLDGVTLPVFDLARYFGMAREPHPKPMLLTIAQANVVSPSSLTPAGGGPDADRSWGRSQEADAAGLLIDGLPQRLRWTPAQQVHTDGSAPRLAPVLRGACLIGDEVWFDIDVSRLLDQLEQSLQET